ncbi:MAG: DNA gyrase inhibitor YacG [Pseudomonadales bacterium]|nr:DNA gyrase inhibitor YacG [Pseudomonadales bacterium]
MNTPNEPKSSIKQVNCPTCQKIVRWSEAEPYRPFCSKQCQLIDFGAWATERYGIAEQEGESPPAEEDIDDSP